MGIYGIKLSSTLLEKRSDQILAEWSRKRCQKEPSGSAGGTHLDLSFPPSFLERQGGPHIPPSPSASKPCSWALLSLWLSSPVDDAQSTFWSSSTTKTHSSLNSNIWRVMETGSCFHDPPCQHSLAVCHLGRSLPLVLGVNSLLYGSGRSDSLLAPGNQHDFASWVGIQECLWLESSTGCLLVITQNTPI